MADPEPQPEFLPGSSFWGMDPRRVLDGAMDVAAPGDEEGGPRRTPSVEDMAVLLPEYELISLTGRGGMGTVYHAVQKNLGRPVAIKVLPVDLGDEPGFADRFRREAMTTAG